MEVAEKLKGRRGVGSIKSLAAHTAGPSKNEWN